MPYSQLKNETYSGVGIELPKSSCVMLETVDVVVVVRAIELGVPAVMLVAAAGGLKADGSTIEKGINCLDIQLVGVMQQSAMQRQLIVS